MHCTCTRLFFFLFVIPSWLVRAQPISNDPDPTGWINYAQTYFKIPVAQAGLYRITTADLQQAGVPVGTVNPASLQVFHRGVEQAIYVDGEADGRLDRGDFLEFYGRSNDGTPDSLLYRNDGPRPRNAQPHAYYSLFNDTTAYFLTWRLDRSAGAGQPGRRMAAYTDTNYANLAPEPYHWAEELRLFTDTYPGWAAGIPPKIEYSHYEAGEGYTGVVQQKDKPYDTVFNLPNAVRTGPNPQVDVLLVGRDYTGHHVECQVGPTPDARRLLGAVRFSVYDNAHLEQNMAWTDVGADGRVVVSTLSRGDGSTVDRYSISYIRLRYPQQLTANGQPLRTFQVVLNRTGKSLLNITAVPADTRFWDISDPNAPVRIGATNPAVGTARLVVRGTDTARTILSASQPKPVTHIQPVTFTNWANRRPTYLIISHEALIKSTGVSAVGTPNAVQAYAAYRASVAGGGHDTLTVSIGQLVNQYSYGERHPLAIRRFADQLLRQSRGSTQRPQYLLLIGRSRSTPGIRRDPRQAQLDLVMTAGFPGSDGVFTAGLDGQPRDVPALPTGRINAGTPQEVSQYLDKVKEYESATGDALWRKNLLHLSGGENSGEAATFRTLVDAYRQKAEAQLLGARVTTLAKQTDNPVELINVAKPVNEGVGLMTFFGHSGLDVTDLDIGFCSNDALGYRNKGRYPILLINGCAIGNFYFGRPTLTADWVLTPDRGAIAALAHSHLGYTPYLNQYSTEFYNLLADSTQLSKSIGQLQQETIRRVLAQAPGGWSLANCQQMVLQGDPAIRPFPFETPDYALTTGGLTIRGAEGQPLTTGSDSVRIRAIVQNAGQYRPGPLSVRIRRLVNGRESGVFNLMSPRTVAYRDTLTFALPNERDAEGLNQFDVTINPTGPSSLQPPAEGSKPTTPAQGLYPEVNRSNNSAVVEVTIAGQKPALIYPAPGSTVKTTLVRLTAEYKSAGSRVFELELDSTDRFDSPFRLSRRIITATVISYSTTLPTRPNTTYYWRVRLVDNTGSPVAGAESWSAGSFVYAPDSPAAGLPEGQIWLAQTLPAGVQQGDVVLVPVQFTNLSPYPFADSLVVRQTVYAAGLSEPQTIGWRLKAPAPGDTLRFTARVATEKLPGINRVVLTVNPRLQPEHSFLNNTLDLPLPVQPDVLGPLLEVAFDGARIENDAVVSARPLIDVLVADDNRALIQRDTTGLDLYLRRAGENQPFKRLDWRGATVRSTVADNVFRVQYPSPTLVEGAYQLLVTARDAVGNPAAPYQTGFRVVRERRLTDFIVYPNPFRDRVLFTFRLTGEKAPDQLTLTITDLSGRVVRHLSQAQSGMVQGRSAGRVGLNEWAWDGRAESGEPLPNGVYLYQLSVSADGQLWPVADAVQAKLRGRIVLTR